MLGSRLEKGTVCNTTSRRLSFLLSLEISKGRKCWHQQLMRRVRIREMAIHQMLCSLLQDDIEAYRTQNRFLNSEIHQVTKIWRRVAEKERALLMKVRGRVRLHAQSPFSPLPSQPCIALSLSPACPASGLCHLQTAFLPQASVL